MEFTKKDEERIVRLTGLKSCCSYFQNQKHGNKLFEPEFEFSKKINDILDSSLQVTPIELTEIINIINSLNQKEYYKGSGWFDYLLQVKDYLEFYGFNIEIKDGNMSELRVKN